MEVSFSAREMHKWWSRAFEVSDFKNIPSQRKKLLLNAPGWSVSSALETFSGVQFNRYYLEPFNQHEHHIQRRFAKVFEQAYVRFIDLQKAEAQAREAQIETALERVRSKTMAMQRSEEIGGIVYQVFSELRKLNIVHHLSGIATEYATGQDWFNMWYASEEHDYAKSLRFNFFKHRSMDSWKVAHENGVEFISDSYSKKEKDEYWDLVFSTSTVTISKERKKYLYETPGLKRFVAISKNSSLFVFRYNNDDFSEDDENILIRFGKLFEQSYTRFLDLKKAEFQAKEAIKQASIDRVRGEIASMRTKDDLDRIIPLVWKELTNLGVPFIRCGVFIMNEEKRVIHSYLSTPEGQSLSAFDMSFDSKVIASQAVEHWYKKQIYHDYWDKQKFLSFTQELYESGVVKDIDSYRGKSAPPESLYLNFVPFKQGMLYVGNTESLNEEALELVQSLADSFSIAYARYEDFKQLEEAKLKTEQTLDELKSAQSQLIQSEKMASLGELTAGIAHEIQNPLNFVNNFSEVSKELIAEMQEEIKNKNYEDAEEISMDIDNNLEKINHHGKRAEAIVKGMLQHSRINSGEKELTDINSLSDEYLRLSYHGLRAKDKSFKADFKLETDAALPKIMVIPQDIGRVLLNLINNAFYAVDKRNKNQNKAYKPLVIVKTNFLETTSKNKIVEISVSDNGTGISKEIKDKIFQPFFTTKPTGQGTGLGLSLSYDIINAHGGIIKMESKEKIGTTFKIELPI